MLDEIPILMLIDIIRDENQTQNTYSLCKNIYFWHSKYIYMPKTLKSD